MRSLVVVGTGGRSRTPVRRTSLATCLVLALAAAVAPGQSLATHEPASGSFVDDDGNTHEAMIEAIVAEGITQGCDTDPPRYCPTQMVTRGQMATFLVRAFQLPPASQSYFSDVDGNPHEDAINRLAEAGVTSGFADGTYRPHGRVVREQMATFLAKAMGLEPVEGSRFEDVSGPHEGNVNAVADEGISVGCNPDGTRFCPRDPVRRDAMASFIGRALGLDPVPPSAHPVRAAFEGLKDAPGGPVTIMTVIAAGPDRIVSMGNRVTTITDKHGNVIDSRANTDFFDPALPDHDLRHVTDPHIVFDPTAQRFFAVEAAMDVHGDRCGSGAICSEYQLLAVSKDAYPQSLGPDDWHLYALDRTIRRTADGTVEAEGLGDQDFIAVGGEAVVIRHHDYDLDDGSPQAANIRIIEKAPLLEGQAPSTWRDITGLTEPETEEGEFHLAIVPADDGSGRFFLVNQWTWGSCLDPVVWRLDDPLGAADLTHEILDGVDPPQGCSTVRQQARQRGEPDIWTARATNSASLVDGSLWTTALVTVDHPAGDAMGVGWVEIDVSSWPPRLIQEGVLADPDVDRYEPVIAVDPHGNAAILYGQSSPTDYPALYVAYRLADDPAGALRTPLLLRAADRPHEFVTGSVGDHSHHGYMDAARDPADGSLWFIGEYPVAEHRWGGWVANLRLR